MAYLSLYRKFRPTTFDEVKGQDHIVTSLKNQVKYNRFAHAYLFCGTRGTGKTSVAKILARVVNCESPVDGNPCGECSRCKAALDGSSINIIEMDAASNNGVDNIRQINEEVAYSPTDDKYKVYIIDEVHMLSPGAFNALLKTLEEPPSYVIFILATTEYAKIPITILSRCQKYDFKHISVDVIYGRLKELMEKENIKADERALRYIAKVADGSMRDALSLLDRCIAFYLGEELTFEKVLDVLGAVDTDVFERLLGAIITKDVNESLKIVEEMVLEGRELQQMTNDFIWYMRNLLLVKISDNAEEVVDLSPEKISEMKYNAKLFEDAVIMRYIRVLSEAANSMKQSSQPRIIFETAIIKLIKPSMESDTASLLNRITDIEKKLESGFVSNSVVSGQVDNTIEEKYEDKTENDTLEGTLTDAVPEDIQYVINNWERISNAFPALYKALTSKMSKYVDKDGSLCLMSQSDSVELGMLVKEGYDKDIEEILAKETGKNIKVLLVTDSNIKDNSDNYRKVNPFNIEIEEED